MPRVVTMTEMSASDSTSSTQCALQIVMNERGGK